MCSSGGQWLAALVRDAEAGSEQIREKLHLPCRKKGE